MVTVFFGGGKKDPWTGPHEAGTVSGRGRDEHGSHGHGTEGGSPVYAVEKLEAQSELVVGLVSVT